MVDIRRLFKDHAESGALSSLVKVYGFVDEMTALTKSGELLSTISLRGQDAECSEQSLIEALTARTASALRIFDERFVVNHYLLKRSNPNIEAGHYPNIAVEGAVRNRAAYLSAKGAALNTFEGFMTVALRPDWRSPRIGDRLASLARHPLEAIQTGLRAERRMYALDEKLAEARRTLDYAVKSFLEQTAEHLYGRVLTRMRHFYSSGGS